MVAPSQVQYPTSFGGLEGEEQEHNATVLTIGVPPCMWASSPALVECVPITLVALPDHHRDVAPTSKACHGQELRAYHRASSTIHHGWRQAHSGGSVVLPPTSINMAQWGEHAGALVTPETSLPASSPVVNPLPCRCCVWPVDLLTGQVHSSAV